MAQHAELLASELVKQNEKIDVSALEGKYVMLYFSAFWCPPCRGFTPVLAEFYKQLQAEGKPVEIVFVSSDRDQASFDEYFASMPWIALPYSERDAKNRLATKYGITGIPTLVILDKELNTITKDGRAMVMKDPRSLSSSFQ